eukprot:scaffold1513_cov100-Amphora_coffeaeformis.AAC.31
MVQLSIRNRRRRDPVAFETVPQVSTVTTGTFHVKVTLPGVSYNVAFLGVVVVVGQQIGGGRGGLTRHDSSPSSVNIRIVKKRYDTPYEYDNLSATPHENYVNVTTLNIQEWVDDSLPVETCHILGMSSVVTKQSLLLFYV